MFKIESLLECVECLSQSDCLLNRNSLIKFVWSSFFFKTLFCFLIIIRDFALCFQIFFVRRYLKNWTWEHFGKVVSRVLCKSHEGNALDGTFYYPLALSISYFTWMCKHVCTVPSMSFLFLTNILQYNCFYYHIYWM